MNKKITFILFIIFTLLLSVPIKANINQNIKIRIGLSSYKDTQNVFVSNSEIYVGYGIDNNFSQKASINSASGFNIKSLNYSYIKLNAEFSSYEQATSYIDQNRGSFDMYPALTGVDKWSIYIGQFETKNLAEKFFLNTNIVGDVVTPIRNFIGIYANEKLILIYDLEKYNLQIASNFGKISLNGKEYREEIEFKTNGSKFTLINVLDLDKYLYGVVPSEMPSSWHKEALKAQSVASRNFAYNKLAAHINEGYDLCDTTHCQVYKGASAEKDTTTAAINETKNVLAYYNNKPITTFYYSSNGGQTESAENVWSQNFPYLKSFKDPYEKNSKIWQRAFTFDELTNLAKDIGNVTNCSITINPENNRVKSLVLTGTNGIKTLEKEQIRTFFSPSKGGSLESRNFTISNSINITDSFNLYVSTDKSSAPLDTIKPYVINNNKNVAEINDQKDLHIITKSGINNSNSSGNSTTISLDKKDTNSIIFSGKGWGHGVGMSQYGANSMANDGYGYKDILEFYYKGIEIK